jgi:uncharacterized protein (DUF433 family)
VDTGIVYHSGGMRIAGTRITVYDIAHYLEAGDWNVTEIAEILQLTEEQVLAAIAYIEEHKAEVMAVHQEIEERIAQGNPPEVEAKLAATRAKMQAGIRSPAILQWCMERRFTNPT